MLPYDPIYDLNGDGIIDEADFEIFKRYFFQTVANNPEAAIADFNGDGKVNALDFSLLNSHLGGIKLPEGIRFTIQGINFPADVYEWRIFFHRPDRTESRTNGARAGEPIMLENVTWDTGTLGIIAYARERTYPTHEVEHWSPRDGSIYTWDFADFAFEKKKNVWLIPALAGAGLAILAIVLRKGKHG